MKKLFILTCLITALGCSSTGNIKIVSPSTPEKEAKEEIRKAPVTRLETASQPPAGHEATDRRDAVEESHRTDNIKIVSPSTPEKEAREEIRKAPVTRLETASQPPASHEATGGRHVAAGSPAAAAAIAHKQAAAPSPSIKSPHTVEALINLLEKKGVILEEELLQEIKKLEGKDK
jgi:hypothetical protein